MTAIPPRASAYSDCPFGFPQWPFAVLGPATVWVDGSEMKKVVTYSIPEGWVQVCELDKYGRVFARGDEIARKLIYGSVRVTAPDQVAL